MTTRQRKARGRGVRIITVETVHPGKDKMKGVQGVSRFGVKNLKSTEEFSFLSFLRGRRRGLTMLE